MPTLQETLQAAITQVDTDADIFHAVVHGGAGETVTTEGGEVNTVAHAIANLGVQANYALKNLSNLDTAGKEYLGLSIKDYYVNQINGNDIHDGLTSLNPKQNIVSVFDAIDALDTKHGLYNIYLMTGAVGVGSYNYPMPHYDVSPDYFIHFEKLGSGVNPTIVPQVTSNANNMHKVKLSGGGIVFDHVDIRVPGRFEQMNPWDNYSFLEVNSPYYTNHRQIVLEDSTIIVRDGNTLVRDAATGANVNIYCLGSTITGAGSLARISNPGSQFHLIGNKPNLAVGATLFRDIAAIKGSNYFSNWDVDNAIAVNVVNVGAVKTAKHSFIRLADTPPSAYSTWAINQFYDTGITLTENKNTGIAYVSVDIGGESSPGTINFGIDLAVLYNNVTTVGSAPAGFVGEIKTIGTTNIFINFGVTTSRKFLYGMNNIGARPRGITVFIPQYEGISDVSLAAVRNPLTGKLTFNLTKTYV